MARRRAGDGEHPAYDPGSCGPDGLAQCRRCLAPVHPPRREFCSPACEHEFLIRASPAYARRAVFARDRGVCTHCRLPCGRLDRILAIIVRGSPPDDPEAGRKHALEFIAALGFGRRTRVISLWQADHRTAVAEGGGECGLGNLRTLCLACHAEQTRQLHLRLVQARTGPARFAEAAQFA